LRNGRVGWGGEEKIIPDSSGRMPELRSYPTPADNTQHDVEIMPA
jgi:hypothetical protein